MADAQTYAFVDSETREIINLVVWDGESEFDLPDGFELVLPAPELVEEVAVEIGGTIEEDAVTYEPPPEDPAP